MSATPQGSTPGPSLADRMVIALEHEARAKDARIDALEARERELVGALDQAARVLENDSDEFQALGFHPEGAVMEDIRDTLKLIRALLAPASAEVEG